MQLVAATSDSIQKYDEQVEKLGRENYGHTKLVRQVTGVGPVTVLAYVSTLENPKRFTKSGESALRLCRVPG